MSKMCTTNNDKNNDKQRILIVDDESDITTALKIYLEIQGFDQSHLKEQAWDCLSAEAL